MSAFVMRTLFAALAALVLASCSVHEPAPDGWTLTDAGFGGLTEGGRDAPFDSPDTGPLTDAQIVGVLLAVHRGDVAVTDFVRTTTVREDVRAFANDLHARHAAAEAALVAAASAAGVTPVDSSISARQASLRAQLLQRLTEESCAMRDTSYLALQALYTSEALVLVDDNLLPAVGASLRDEVDAARAILVDEAAGLPVADGATPEASVPNWEAGESFDSGCPDLSFDAYIDVGADS